MEKSQKDKADVKAAFAQFYKALNEMFKGDLAPMSAVWSHANDVSYLGPQGGILVGWDNVLKSWKDQAAMKLGGTVEAHDMHLFINDNIAIIQNHEVGINYVKDSLQTIKIRATNIFRNENGQWKMISHQTDRLSHLKK